MPFYALVLCTQAAAAPADFAGIQRRVEQLEIYLVSDVALGIQNGSNEPAKELLARAGERVEAVKASIRQADPPPDLDLASERIDEAYRAYYEAIESQRAGRVNQADLKRRNRDLRAEIDTYHEAYAAGLLQKGPAAAGLLNEGQFRDLLKEADGLESSGDYTQAQDLLKDAYNLVIIALTRLRENETVVYALDFQTPADEYRYEQNRHEGYLLLVERVKEGPPKEQAYEFAKRYLDQGLELRTQAENEAGDGDFVAAISSMENANRALKRFLQMMGVAVP